MNQQGHEKLDIRAVYAESASSSCRKFASATIRPLGRKSELPSGQQFRQFNCVIVSHSKGFCINGDFLSAVFSLPAYPAMLASEVIANTHRVTTSQRRHLHPIIAPRSRRCRYKIPSCRSAWLNRDPKREIGGINLYRYVNNDPVTYFDPNGLVFRPGQFFGGLGATLLGVAGMFGGAASSELGVGVPIAISGAIGFQYGMANMAAAFADDPELAKTAKDLPPNLGGAVGRVCGGKQGQNIGSFIENAANVSNAEKATDAIASGLGAYGDVRDVINEAQGNDDYSD